MSGRRPRSPRYHLSFHPDVETDQAALDPEGHDAAQAILDDLAHGRVIGKALGDRNVSGSLSGLARVTFDTPGRRPPRFRVVYRDLDDTRDVLAIGPRDQHAIYRTAVGRLGPNADPSATENPGER